MSKKFFTDFYDANGDRIPVYFGLGNHDTPYYFQPPITTSEMTRDYFDYLSNLYLDGKDSLAMGKYDKSRSMYKQIGSYVVKDIFDLNHPR